MRALNQGEKKMKIALFLLALLLVSTVVAVRANPAEPIVLDAYARRGDFEQKGSRTEDLVAKFYGNVQTAYTALKAKEIDMIGSELTYDLYADAVADPTILLAPVSALDMYEFDLNNNWTISHYPGIQSPMTYTGFRQALARLTDKPYIVQMICGGLAERIDQPIAAPQKSWTNESVSYPFYPYEFNPAAAAALLDELSAQGTTPNPYYDAIFPGSVPYVRTYPLDHAKAGMDLDPLEVVVRSDDSRMYLAGQHLCGNMRKHGIPLNVIVGSLSAVYDKVFGDHNYHIYTGNHRRLERYPPIYVYSLFHTHHNNPYGPNYANGFTGDGSPNHSNLNDLLYQTYTAADLSEAMQQCKRAMGLFTELAVSIPLWSTRSYYAYRNLLGVANMAGYGIINDYTFLNAYRQGLGQIRIGVIGDQVRDFRYPMATWEVLDLTYDTLFVPNPYNLAVDQPWLAQDWSSGTWFDAGEGKNKTLLTFWLRTNTTYDASDVDLTLWYLKGSCPSLDAVEYWRIVDAYTIEVYMNTIAYSGLYSIGGLPILRAVDVFYSEYGVSTVSDGMYYPTAYVPGDCIAFERNSYSWMETPQLGEIDWNWKWNPGPSPRTGYYQIDIFDLVRAAGAYGSHGAGPPDPRWFPGADLASTAGLTDIFDIVTAAAKYARKFWDWARTFVDFDHDGILDNKDIDDDGDGVPDNQDSNPRDPQRSRDTDKDGIDDTADPDIDNDGTANGPDGDEDGDGNSDAFERLVNEKRQHAYNICNKLIDEALRAQEKMSKKGDALDDGGELGDGTLGRCEPFGPNTGETTIDTEDEDVAGADGDPDKPGEQDGHLWDPVDRDGDGDHDQSDVIETIVHEARHAWQMELRGRSEKELGKDLDGDGNLEDDVRENDKDGDGLPDTVPAGTEADDIKDPDGGTTPSDWETEVKPRLETDAHDFDDKVPTNPWW